MILPVFNIDGFASVCHKSYISNGDLLIMKNRNLNLITGLALAASIFSTSTFAAEPLSAATESTIQKTLSGVRAPELPAKAAALVERVPVEEREAVTVAVVKAAIKANPTTAPAVVGAIARVAPKMAALAAATAVSLEPKQAAAIARAAASAAPLEAEQIIAAMTKENPAIASLISQSVSLVVSPKLGEEPQLFKAPPTVGPPFVPRLGGTGEINRTNTTVVPPNDRDYSNP